MEEFDRGNLAANIAEFTGLDTDTVLKVLNAETHILAWALSIPDFGGRVEVHQRGVYKLEHRAARHGKGFNGEDWSTPERQEVVFHAAPAFAQKIAEGTKIVTY
jgi:nucleoid DNA-binding protein